MIGNHTRKKKRPPKRQPLTYVYNNHFYKLLTISQIIIATPTKPTKNKAIPNKNIGISPKILYNMFMPPHSPNTSECPPLLSNPC